MHVRLNFELEVNADNQCWCNICSYRWSPFQWYNWTRRYWFSFLFFLQAVEKTAKIKCTCQGKGCTFKICWKQVSTFRHIGTFLKNRYKKAKYVQFIDGQLHQRKYKTTEKVTIKKKHLTYLRKSPNYCTKNQVLNIEGTEGRQCSRNKNTTNLSEQKSCKTLCVSCGYKVIRKQNKYVCLK